ncbi:MAG: thiol-disulfide oxidoreductase DCC family protein [Halorhabdus sp.]
MIPILVYDDDCGFCTRAATFVARHGTVDIVGFSAVTPDLRDRLPEGYRDCAHLLTDDAVYSCGEAIERALAETELVPSGLFAVCRSVPGYPSFREWGYRRVANNRETVGRLIP